jgi:tripartite-type tricarboxylate transporter receptor subunit TctC
MTRFLLFLSVALGTAIAGLPAAAQYPEKPIRLIVPVPAGGPADSAARLLAQELSKSVGQPIVVENRPGAGGAIAAQTVLSAPADGHTLLWGIYSLTGIPLLQKSPPFQSLSEFTPVSIVGSLAFGMFVHPGVPATSVADFVTYARTRPDELNYATGTLGEYVAATQFFKGTGVSAVRVPYKGTAQLMPDLLSGRVQFNFGPVSGGLQHVREGKLRILAVLLPQRLAIAQDVPTMIEAGVPSVTWSAWQAIFAPPKTPSTIATRLSRELAAVLRVPSLRTQLEQQGMQVEGSSPEALVSAVAQATQAWQTLIREYGIPQE